MSGGVCLDTNLLVLLVIGRARPDLIGRHKRLRRYAVSDLAALEELLSRSSCKIATASVLTETSNLIGSGRDALSEAYAGQVAGFVADAETVTLDPKDVCAQPSFADFGYTDAALLLLARSGVTIITDDRPLVGVLTKRAFPVLNFNTLRYADR